MGWHRMLLGGVVLTLLLGGIGIWRGCGIDGAPPSVTVTRNSSPELLPVTAGAARSASHMPASRVAAGAEVGAAPASAAPHPPAEIADAVVVHVVGAVRKPGVYRLAPKARLVDAMHAAGGAKASADLEAINLASFAQDGEQIRVPALSERRPARLTVAASPVAPRARSMAPARRPVRSLSPYPLAEAAAVASGALPAPARVGSKGVGLVNINTADAQALATLPGVGPKTAEAILRFRQEHGPFQRPEDLMAVRGIRTKKFARMRDWVVVR